MPAFRGGASRNRQQQYGSTIQLKLLRVVCFAGKFPDRIFSQVASVIARSRSPRRKLQDFQLDATEAEVQIGQALDVQGNDLPLETAHWVCLSKVVVCSLIAVVVLPRLGVSHSVSQSVSQLVN